MSAVLDLYACHAGTVVNKRPRKLSTPACGWREDTWAGKLTARCGTGLRWAEKPMALVTVRLAGP
jgi:hypothetical protein